MFTRRSLFLVRFPVPPAAFHIFYQGASTVLWCEQYIRFQTHEIARIWVRSSTALRQYNVLQQWRRNGEVLWDRGRLIGLIFPCADLEDNTTHQFQNMRAVQRSTMRQVKSVTSLSLAACFQEVHFPYKYIWGHSHMTSALRGGGWLKSR